MWECHLVKLGSSVQQDLGFIFTAGFAEVGQLGEGSGLPKS